jgi:hypothetical protein
MDMWISSIIEGYIYEKTTKVDKYGFKTENKMKYNKTNETKQWYKKGQMSSLIQNIKKDKKKVNLKSGFTMDK